MILIGLCGASLHRDKLRLDYLGGVLVKSTLRNDMWLVLSDCYLFPERLSRKVEAVSITQHLISLYLVRFVFFQDL